MHPGILPIHATLGADSVSHDRKRQRLSPNDGFLTGLAIRIDEREQVRRARAGDQRALRGLYDAHVDRVFRLAFRMSGDEVVAREATQGAFVRAFQRLDQFRGDASFSTWIHTIARSVTLNEIRRKSRHATRERELEEGVTRPAAAAPRLEPDARDRIHAAVDGLPDIYRDVFLMHDLEGYRHEDIAEMLDVAVGTSKARLSRARQKLRDALMDIAEDYVG